MKTETALVPIRPHNCTICGYRGRDLWAWLQWEYRKHGFLILKDSSLSKETGYEYLHVPAWHPEDGECGVCSYRVRPALEPSEGATYRGQKVVFIKPVQVEGVWNWEYQFALKVN